MAPVTFSAVYLPLLLSSLALICCVLSFLFFKAYIKRRTSREWIIQDGILTEIREEVNALLKTIDETTDRDITLIKERENNLKSLLGEVEKRLKVYIREMDKRKEAENTISAIAATANPGTTILNEEGTYLDLGKLRYRLKREEAAQPPEDPTPVKYPTVNDQIRTFLREGLSAQAIASRLGLSITEVEFTAALIERREDKT